MGLPFLLLQEEFEKKDVLLRKGVENFVINLHAGDCLHCHRAVPSISLKRKHTLVLDHHLPALGQSI